MSTFKKLAGQTAIYGLSSILGRFLVFFLTPLHTEVLSQSDFGKNTDIYAVIAFLMVILTFGMETTFFRYYQEKSAGKENHEVLRHTLFPVIGFSVLFLLLLLLFLPQVASVLKYSNNPEYPVYAFFIVMLDAVCAVPFAKLRAENRGIRFVSIRLTQIVSFFILNYFFFRFCPWLLEHGYFTSIIERIYTPSVGVAYIFISNLLASGLMFLMLLPELKGFKPVISWRLEKKYLAYAAPLVVAGLAGIANEMADRQFLKYLLPGNDEQNFAQLGIYGANYKIAMFMMIFIQAFRFAAEPFFFSQAKEKDQRKTYAQILKYFTLFQTLIFVGLVGYIDVVKIFIDQKYWSGLYLAPILLFANLLVGVNLNLNIWYKLQDKTRFGAYITFVGLFFTVLLNILLIPTKGILGAAIATLVSYAAMTVYAYYLNQKHYKCPYETGRIILYLGISLALGYLSFVYLRQAYLLNTLVLAAFAGFILVMEKNELKKLKTK